jgi:hypothetical protein
MAESCWDLIIRLSVRNQRRRFFVRFSSAHVRSDMIRRTILIRSCYLIFRPGIVLKVFYLRKIGIFIRFFKTDEDRPV